MFAQLAFITVQFQLSSTPSPPPPRPLCRTFVCEIAKVPRQGVSENSVTPKYGHFVMNIYEIGKI